MYTIILTLLISFQALACPSYQLMEEGDKSPCKGLFLNQSSNEIVKKDLRDNELRKKQIELKDLQLKEITQDRNKWAKQAHNQAKLRYRSQNDLRNGVIAGVGLTLISIFLVRKLDK